MRSLEMVKTTFQKAMRARFRFALANLSECAFDQIRTSQIENSDQDHIGMNLENFIEILHLYVHLYTLHVKCMNSFNNACPHVFHFTADPTHSTIVWGQR